MPRPAFDRFNGESPETWGSYADAYDTRALLRRGWGGAKHPMDKKLSRRCDDFCAQLLTLKKYSPAGLLTEDEARRMAASILLK
jgi:hypothetical protein